MAAMMLFPEKPLARRVWRHWLAVRATVTDPQYILYLLLQSELSIY